MPLETVICVPDRHAVIPGGGPVGAVPPPPVAQARSRATTYTLIREPCPRLPLQYRSAMLAVAAAAGLALVAGWLPALVTVVTVATPSAVLWRTHQHTNPAVIDTARPSLELVS